MTDILSIVTPDQYINIFWLKNMYFLNWNYFKRKYRRKHKLKNTFFIIFFRNYESISHYNAEIFIFTNYDIYIFFMLLYLEKVQDIAITPIRLHVNESGFVNERDTNQLLLTPVEGRVPDTRLVQPFHWRVFSYTLGGWRKKGRLLYRAQAQPLIPFLSKPSLFCLSVISSLIGMICAPL